MDLEFDCKLRNKEKVRFGWIVSSIGEGRFKGNMEDFTTYFIIIVS